jgi:hypothetical protein
MLEARLGEETEMRDQLAGIVIDRNGTYDSLMYTMSVVAFTTERSAHSRNTRYYKSVCAPEESI